MAPARQLDASPITPSTDTSDGWSCHLCQRKYSTARQLVRHWKDVEGLLVDQIKSWYPYTVYSEERLVGTKRIVMSDLEREHVLLVPKKKQMTSGATSKLTKATLAVTSAMNIFTY